MKKLSNSSNEKDFNYTIDDEEFLDSPLNDDIANQFISSPYFSELIYHGMLRFYKMDGTKFAKGESLTQGSSYCFHQPNLEGEEKSIYQIDELVLDKNYKKISINMVKPSARSIFQRLKTTVIYDMISYKDKPLIKVHFAADTYNSAAINVIKIIFKQVFKRLKKLATNPDNTLEELRLVSTMSFKLHDKANFYNLALGASVQFLVPGRVSNLIKKINSLDFLEKLFPKVTQLEARHNNHLAVDDVLHMVIGNMQRDGINMKITEENIQLTIVECIQSETSYTLNLLSNKKVDNFYQFGYGISLTDDDNNKTMINMGVYHNKSYLVSTTHALQSAVSVFTSSIPDPILLLQFSSISFLISYFKHMCAYLHSELEINYTTIEPVNALKTNNLDANKMSLNM